jgi:hypothetical protein
MLDTKRLQLDTWVKVGAPPAAVAAAQRYLDERERIEAERLREDRENEELIAAAATAKDALREVMAAEDRRIDAETAAALSAEEVDRAARRSERRTLADVISLDRLRTTDNPAELLRLVNDAAAHGATLGDEARAVALQRARTEAAREQRTHRLNGLWFRALCALSTGTEAGPAQDLAARGESRKRHQRQLVAKVGEAVGLSGLLAPKVEAMAARPTLSAGSFFDRFPNAMRG